MNRTEILDTAKQYVTVDRAATHGNGAEDSFQTIADFWSAYLVAETAPGIGAGMWPWIELHA